MKNLILKDIKNDIKVINEILKGVVKDDKALDEARNNTQYNAASLRQTERFYDIMKQINELAKDAARLYNFYAFEMETGMTAEATYKMTTY